MPEVNNEQKDKNLTGQEVKQTITPETPEANGEVAAEQLPPEEVKEIRESIIEEITKAEQPTPLVAEKPPVEELPTVTPPPPPPVKEKSATYQKIEKIMEEGLVEVYLSLPVEQQKIFKIEGEKTVTKIEQLLQKAKVKIKEILQLIRQWLKLIPGVNKFFLEQEAKIKTDKILKIKNE